MVSSERGYRKSTRASWSSAVARAITVAVCAAIFATLCLSRPLSAQTTDTVRPRPDTTRPVPRPTPPVLQPVPPLQQPTQPPPQQTLPLQRADSLKPPISPGRAFFTSLLLPGYAQSKLDRPTATILYATVEVLALGMARKSAQDLRIAKSNRSDSIIIGYTLGTGNVLTPTYGPGRFTSDRIKARRTHYEDWIAVILFNHLISAADAYVSANLWDFKANVSVSDGQRRATITARKSF